MKTPVHLSCLLASLLFTSLPFFSTAQSVDVSGRCFDPAISLPMSGTNDGKNYYENLNGTYQGQPTPIAVYWDATDMLWYIVLSGTERVFQAPGNGSMMPPGSAQWTSFAGGLDTDGSCTDMTPLSVSGDVVLPVELLAFEAKMTAPNKVQIAWQVAQEQQLSGYEILKSQNASDWQSIGFVKAQNSMDKTNYEYYDLQPNTNITYYQLRSINNDATSRLSAIVSVNGLNSAKQNPLYSPNPTSGRLNLPFSTSVQTSVFDMTGKLLLQNNSNTELDISAFPKGTYILKIQAEGTVWQQKITKI